MRPSCAASLVVAALSLSGCATPPQDPAARAAFDEANDPIEPFNRFMFDVNLELDSYFLKPVARTYRDAVPEVLRDSLRNFLRNLRSPLILAHDLLQGEPGRASVTLERFLINSTVGVAGFIDFSGEAMDLPFHDEDAGQTLAVWGLSEGPYLVLPVLGPSNVRDAAGFAVDNVIDPVSLTMQAYGITYGPFVRAGLNVLDVRSRNIDTLDDVQRSSIDFYATLRSLYRQRRAQEIGNGRAGKDDSPAPTPLSGSADDIVPSAPAPTSSASAAPAGAGASAGPPAVAMLPPEPATAPETASATADQPAAAAAPTGNPGLRGGIITFRNGSVALSASDRRMLRSIAAVALASGARILVVCQAEDELPGDKKVGLRFTTFELSGERADAVAHELQRDGIAPDRVVVETGDLRFSETPALAQRPTNRRVDVILQPPA